MEARQVTRYGRLIPLILFVVGGTVIGVLIGHLLWSSGAGNYSVIAQSNEIVRTVKVGDFSVTFPSVIISEAGKNSTISIGISNLDDDPRYVAVALSLVRSSGVDSATITTLTGNSYTVTIAAYGTANDILSFKPSSNGYAIFDLIVRGELVGNLIVYVVPSTAS